MQSIKHKLIAALLAMALLAGSLSVLAPSYPARAQMATATVIDIPAAILNGVLKAVEGGLYVVLRKATQQFVRNLTKDTANYLLKGGRGKGPAYETKPWNNFWQETGDEAFGAALEGFVQGSVNSYEAQKKKEAVYKSLEDTRERTKQLSLEGGDLNYKLKDCNKKLDEVDPEDNAGFHAQYAECEGVKTQLEEKGKEQVKFYKDNAGKLKAQGIREDYSRDLERLQGELAALRTEEANLCNTQTTVYPDDPCKNKRTEITDKGREIDAVTKNADTAFAEASPETSEAIRGIEKEQIKKDAALVTGQTGALSEAGRTIVDIVCKPEADFALQIFLGLGDQISQTKRKPICPLDVFKKNWKTIFDAGFEPGGILSEQTVNGWQNLAALVNPETSDLGVAWKLSVSGHDVRDLARQLGVTDFDALSALGGYKPIGNIANTLVHTPAGLAKETVDRTVEANFEGATRFVPTGHIVADLVITAGAAFLETTLTLVKDGLRKRQVDRRQPKGTNLSGLRPFLKSPIYSPDGDPNAGIEAFAEATLAVFDELTYTGEQSWNVLNKITATGNEADCYNPGIDGVASVEQKSADPESCAIDEDFNRAIREGMTVQQAITNTLLDENGIFGFDILDPQNADAQPQVSSSTKNYPYNSLVILRKYRIIPVSWELAALYIKGNKATARVACNGKNCTLGVLKNNFNVPDSPFYQMVDPNWVLKVPLTQCMLEGYGPQVIQDDLFFDHDSDPDTPPLPEIIRRKTCVDYQTCLGEDAAGKCERGYGYCLKEETIAHFTGETCKPIYDGCRAFTDATTKQNLTVLTGSLTDYKSGVCIADNAGCAWYSTSQRLEPVSASDARVKLDSGNRAKTFIEDTVRKEWLDTDKVFFASKAQKCEPKVEGCRQVDGPAGTLSYLRLPPTSLRCGANGVKEDGSEVQWYKREECKKYTQLCKQEYVGCEQYLPENESIAVTGKSPDDSAHADPTKRYQYRCPAACANIYNYAEQKTLFEVPGDPATTLARTVLFSADTAQKCSVNDVGCEEFTNLDEVARGGEGKDYFTYLQRCVKEDNPENIPANEVFYHFVGSDTAGGQPEKHYVEGEGAPGDGYAPKCADASKPCDCSAGDAKKSLYDPRIGTVPCREFINANGKPFYRYTDNLIYRTPDCTSYRRTIDNQAGIAHTYSPGLSRRCSAAAVDCREYRAPQAGNVRVVSYDNFEDGSVGAWSENYHNINHSAISNEGEVIGDHSVVMKKSTSPTTIIPVYRFQKPFSFTGTKEYQLSFSIKGKANAFVQAYLHGKNSAEQDVYLQSIPGETQLIGSWQHVSFSFQRHTTQEQLKNTDIRILSYVHQNNFNSPTEDVDTVYIDDIVVREVEGIEYVIRDSWVENREASCFNPKSATDPAPNFDSPAYPGCSLYTDRQGAQQAIHSFERVCPNEMAGCIQATVNDGTAFDRSFDFESSVVPFTPIVGSCVRLEKATNEKNGGAASGKVTILGSIAAKGTSAGAGDCATSAWDSLNPNHYYGVNSSINTGVPIGGRTVTGSAWVKADAGKNVSLLMQASDWDSGCCTSKTIAANGSWQLISVPWSVPARHTTSTIAVRLSYEQQGTANVVLYWDDVGLKETGGGRTEYLIPDQTKACQASDNKCTAYGVPKLLVKNDGTEQLKTAENKASDESRNEWKYREEWNIAYYKVTPEEALAAQSKFTAGDTSPYESGICRTLDLGCRAYSPSGGGDTYFRDPGKRICESPSSGKDQWYYFACDKSSRTDDLNDDIICATDTDCPITAGVQEKCNRDKQILDNGKKPGEAGYSPTCLTEFVKKCPIDASGCRKISDPNCRTDTKTLKDNYGRTPNDAGNSGISCQPEYYFTEDFDTRTKECDGQVNPGAGCILVNDEKKEQAEYQLCQDSGCTTLGTRSASTTYTVAQNDTTAATNPRTYCTCDRNTALESDCDEKAEASPSDPEYCYNRYYNGSAIPERELLRKYKKVFTEERYDSAALYGEAYTKGGSTNRTIQVASNPPNRDANTLVKVRPDRQCKVWLECASRAPSGDDKSKICMRRVACDEGKPGTACENSLEDVFDENGNQIDRAPDYLRKLLQDDVSKTDLKDIKAPRKELLTLSGYARPDYKFADGTTTSGGYSSNFSNWQQQNMRANITAQGLFYGRVLPPNEPPQTPAYKVPQDSDGGYLNACRLYPKQNSPSTFVEGKITNACLARGGSGGIYGFCLQPNPRFTFEYSNDTGAAKRFCLNDISAPCGDLNDHSKPLDSAFCTSSPGLCCRDGNGVTHPDECVYRYYENYCLNWLPIDRTGLEQIFGRKDLKDLRTYYGPNNVYYCRETVVDTKLSTTTIPYTYNLPKPNPERLRISELDVIDDSGVSGTHMWVQEKNHTTPSGEAWSPRKFMNSWNYSPRTDKCHPGGNRWDSNTGNNDSLLILDQYKCDILSPKGTVSAGQYSYYMESPYYIPFNVKEKNTAWDTVESIDYNLEGAIQNCHFDGIAAPQSPGGNFSCKGEYEFGTDGKYTFTLDENKPALSNDFGLNYPETVARGDNFVLKFAHQLDANVSPQQDLDNWDGEMCNDTIKDSRALFVSLKPEIAQNRWKVVFCGNYGILHDAMWQLGAHNYAFQFVAAFFVSATVNFQQPTMQKTMTFRYTNTYCSKYVSTVDSGVAVTRSSFSSSAPFDDASSGANIGRFLDTTGKALVIKSDALDWTNCLDSDDQDRQALSNNNITSCTSPPGDFTSIANAYKIISPLDDVRNQTPFVKAYKKWEIRGDRSGYDEKNDSTTVTNLTTFWDKSRAIACDDTDPNNGALQCTYPLNQQSSNLPRIYYDENKSKANTFNAKGDSDKLTISFFIDVKDSQLPVKWFGVYMPRSRTQQSGGELQDGTGFEDNFIDGGGLRNKRVGEFFEQYTLKAVGQNFFKNKQICIEVKDNWQACTRTCGTSDSNGIWDPNNTSRWTVGACTGVRIP